METQLVRLDKPYNIICDPQGNFSLHIATLIVVEEQETENAIPGKVKKVKKTVAKSYPVVTRSGCPGGEPWMTAELKDCTVLCPENTKEITLYTLKNVMEFCAKRSALFLDMIPMLLSLELLKHHIKLSLPRGENNLPISDYEVSLEFDESNTENGKWGACVAYSSKDSAFYFSASFVTNGPTRLSPEDRAIDKLNRLRNTYLSVLRREGLRSITFTTKDEKHQDFVDKLNDNTQSI